MRHSSGNNSNRRQRSRNGRSGRNGGGNNRGQVFDSNGPDVRIRGTAQQITDKYQTLAKDALSSGDYVAAESYMQHAEHYMRIVNTYAVKKEPEADNGKVADDDGNQRSNDDLSLPNSILGGSADNQVRESEVA